MMSLHQLVGYPGYQYCEREFFLKGCKIALNEEIVTTGLNTELDRVSGYYSGLVLSFPTE